MDRRLIGGGQKIDRKWTYQKIGGKNGQNFNEKVDRK